MSNLDNLNGRELLYRAYDEIYRRELDTEKKRKKGQPAAPLKDEKIADKTPLDFLREGYAKKEDDQ